MRFPELRCA